MGLHTDSVGSLLGLQDCSKILVAKPSGKLLYPDSCQESRSKGYKTFSMLNSTEHEILNAHKHERYQEIQYLLGSDKHRMLFFLLINDKMPTIVGILTFMSRKKFMLSC